MMRFFSINTKSNRDDLHKCLHNRCLRIRSTISNFRFANRLIDTTIIFKHPAHQLQTFGVYSFIKLDNRMRFANALSNIMIIIKSLINTMVMEYSYMMMT